MNWAVNQAAPDRFDARDWARFYFRILVVVVVSVQDASQMFSLSRRVFLTTANALLVLHSYLHRREQRAQRKIAARSLCFTLTESAERAVA